MRAKKSQVPSKGLTHAGIFHADDVFATALLRLLNPHIEVIRSNAVPQGFDGIVYDIGGGEFDHHQQDARVRVNGVPYAAFGLVWEAYGELLLDVEDAAAFDVAFVQPLDLADNTGEPNQLAQCVADFNPMGTTHSQDFDEAFSEAVDWAQNVLCRRLYSIRAARQASKVVRTAMEQGDGKVLVLHDAMPWKEAVVGSGYIYVIYPSLRGGYNVQCVPDRIDGRGVVLPFPKTWWGAPAGKLRTVTGVSDVTFCHRSGFLCSAQSLQGAKALAQTSLADAIDKTSDVRRA